MSILRQIRVNEDDWEKAKQLAASLAVPSSRINVLTVAVKKGLEDLEKTVRGEGKNEANEGL